MLAGSAAIDFAASCTPCWPRQGAPGALAVDYNAKGPVSVSAQKDEAGGRVVVRVANANPDPAVVQLIITGFASQPTVHVTTLNGTSLTQTNTTAGRARLRHQTLHGAGQCRHREKPSRPHKCCI